MIYITEKFSLDMLPDGILGMMMHLNVIRIKDTRRARTGLVDCENTKGQIATSAVGHTEIAAILSELLERPVLPNRITIKMQPDDILFIATYSGPPLPKGATALPERGAIHWYAVSMFKA